MDMQKHYPPAGIIPGGFITTENHMSAAIKWTAAALLAGLTWLVAMYTAEYFRPYKKIRMNGRRG